jgi:hypothetical protein
MGETITAAAGIQSTAPVPNIVLMAGSACFDIPRLRQQAAALGFRLQAVDELREAVLSQTRSPIAAVLFHRDAFGPRCSWFDALRLLREALPGVRLIPCHGFSEEIHWDAIAEQGAWHSLWLPLKDSELHQCLGFLWDALHPAVSDKTIDQPAPALPKLRIPPVCVRSREPSLNAA